MPADRNRKFPDNVPGQYYVDKACLDCGECKEIAPSIFKRNSEWGYFFVTKQPSTPIELAQAMFAVKACPVDAIGDDGNPDGNYPTALPEDEVMKEYDRINAEFEKKRLEWENEGLKGCQCHDKKNDDAPQYGHAFQIAA